MSGTVLLKFTVGPKGELLSRRWSRAPAPRSSTMLRWRRSTAPPRSRRMPLEIASQPIEMQVPFRFITR